MIKHINHDRGSFANLGLGVAIGCWLAFSPLTARADDEDSFQAIQAREDLATDTCIEFDLVEPRAGSIGGPIQSASLGWVSSGVWLDRLRFADAMTEAVREVPIAGLVRDTPNTLNFRSTNETVRIGFPQYMTLRPDGGYLLLDYLVNGGLDAGGNRIQTPARIYFVDENDLVERYIVAGSVLEGKQQNLRILRDANAGRDVVLRDVRKMVPFGDGVVALANFSDRRFPRSPPWDAFVYLTAENHYVPLTSDVQSAVLAPDGQLEKTVVDGYYARSFTYLASLQESDTSESVYILVMDRTPWLGRIRTGETSIARVATIPGTQPPFYLKPNQTSPRSDKIQYQLDTYKMIEAQAMPTSLFQWHDRVFVVEKGKHRDDRTSAHYLREFDWRNERLATEALQLPTRASSDITLLSSFGDEFGLLEKGPVRFLQHGRTLFRATGKTLVIPRLWLDQRHTSLESCHRVALIED